MSKTRANGEGSIRRRADGRWEVRISLGIDFATGQPKRISRYAATQEEAVKLLHELSYIKNTVPRHFNNITLGEWLSLALNTYMKNSLKQSTYNSYESYIRIHFKPALGNLALHDLTPRVLQEFYNYKYEVEGLAPKTITNLNLFLHKALSYAKAEGYIPGNPAECINLPRGPKPQIEILTRDEQARLVHTSYRDRYGVFVRLVLFTGLRLGELLGLRWEDVDFRDGMLYVRRTLNRLNKINPANGQHSTEIVIGTPKSENSTRSIPLLPMALRDLTEWRHIQQNDQQTAGAAYQSSGMIVTNPLGGWIEPRTFKDYYDRMLKSAGLRHFTLHALRHTFASRAMEQGMDPKTLSTILGHYSVSFTLDTYAHVLTDHKKEGMALMEELCHIEPITDTLSYPIIVTMQEDGEMLFEAPDFPAFSFAGIDFQSGIAYMREQIQEEVLTALYPPTPSLPGQLPIAANQLIMQIHV